MPVHRCDVLQKNLFAEWRDGWGLFYLHKVCHDLCHVGLVSGQVALHKTVKVHNQQLVLSNDARLWSGCKRIRVSATHQESQPPAATYNQVHHDEAHFEAILGLWYQGEGLREVCASQMYASPQPTHRAQHLQHAFCKAMWVMQQLNGREHSQFLGLGSST